MLQVGGTHFARLSLDIYYLLAIALFALCNEYSRITNMGFPDQHIYLLRLLHMSSQFSLASAPAQ